MLAEKIIENILSGEMSDAIQQTELILYEKMHERLSEMKEYVAMNLYNEGEDKKPDKESGEYKKFFRLALKKFGVDDVSKLSDEDKPKFYNYLDSNWESDAEEATGKDDPTAEEEDAVAAEKAANRKKMVRDNKDEDDEDEEDEEVDENIMLAPKGKGRKAAKALYNDTTTEDDDLDESGAGRKALTRLKGRYEFGTEPKKTKRDYKREVIATLARREVGDAMAADAPGAGRNPVFQRFKREWRQD